MCPSCQLSCSSSPAVFSDTILHLDICSSAQFHPYKKNLLSGNLTAFISHGEDHRNIKKAGREAGMWFKRTIADLILSMSTSFSLVFSVTPFKIDQNKKHNPLIDKSRIWEMKGGKYAKTLAKIQVRGIFRIRDIRRNVLPKLIEICMETPCWCSPGWAPTWRTETNRNI